MKYTDFRIAWDAALEDADLLFTSPQPRETIEVDSMSRGYEILILWDTGSRAKPFSVAARVSWRWEASHSARSETTEEDLLRELLGEEGYGANTERPWLRVDITLLGTPPAKQPLRLPSAGAWRRWAAGLNANLAPLLPSGETDDDGGIFSWRDNAQADMACDADGALSFVGVELSAWQGIRLPRQWDDPQRPSDEDPEEQLADLARRLRQALDVWADHLAELL